MTKQELLNLLNKYEQAYYSGSSLISDEEYDVLKEQYISKYGEYNFVPNEGDTLFKKVNHIYPLLSLDKVQLSNEEELTKRIEKLFPIVIQPKFDGLSIEIQSDMTFVTRGNGTYGDDVTAQCMKIQNIDMIKPLFDKGIKSLRAEILMTHSSFEMLNEERISQGLKPFDNCRNAASGMLRNKDLSKVKGLTIMIYEDLSSNDSQSKVIDNLINTIGKDQLELSNDYVRITPIYKPADVKSAIDFLKQLDEYKKTIDYDIDGWVVKSDIENSIEVHGGYTSHHPKNAFAVKGQAKGKWTKLKSITWQVGKENITPVAELEPVKIDGSTISRCTLHNISIMEALGLNKITSNTMVKVIKANDVIPRIIEVKYEKEINYVSKKVEYPSFCPVCKSKTAIKKSDSESKILICTNDNCSAKLQAKAELMASREALNIVGLSNATISKILDKFSVTYHSEILHISKEQLLSLDGISTKLADKLYNTIQKVLLKQPADKVLYSCAIPLIGKRASKDICTYYSLNELNDILNKDENEAINLLTKVNGIGKESALSLYKNKDIFFVMQSYIKEIENINNDKITTNKLSFCITGQREPFKSIIENANCKVASSVTKKTCALIASDNNLTTSKAIKAKELNIPILTNEKELQDFLKKVLT